VVGVFLHQPHKLKKSLTLTKQNLPVPLFRQNKTSQQSSTSPVEKAAPAWSYINKQRSLAPSLYQPIVKNKSFRVPVRWPDKRRSILLSLNFLWLLSLFQDKESDKLKTNKRQPKNQTL